MSPHVRTLTWLTVIFAVSLVAAAVPYAAAFTATSGIKGAFATSVLVRDRYYALPAALFGDACFRAGQFGINPSGPVAASLGSFLWAAIAAGVTAGIMIAANWGGSGQPGREISQVSNHIGDDPLWMKGRLQEA